MNEKMPYGWGRVPFDHEARKKWMDLPFSVEEYESRVERLRDEVKIVASTALHALM